MSQLTMTEITPGRLAKEFGLTPTEIYKVLIDLKMPVRRMGATLSPSQEATLRTFLTNTATYEERRRKRAIAERIARVNKPAVRNYPKTCQCCAMRWLFRAVNDEGQPVCSKCADHLQTPDEPIEHRVGRAEAHSAMYLGERDLARELLHKRSGERDAAYTSRLKWMRAMAEVMLDHDAGPDGICWCGDTLPCRTWKKLERANVGIHRQVEKWASFDEDQLDRFLYGDEDLDRESMANEWMRSQPPEQAKAVEDSA